MGAGGGCGRWHCGLRRGPIWGHEACEGCADMGAGGATLIPSPSSAPPIPSKRSRYALLFTSSHQR
eukprot:1345145-Pyramimonas_sp.AAC.1